MPGQLVVHHWYRLRASEARWGRWQCNEDENAQAMRGKDRGDDEPMPKPWFKLAACRDEATQLLSGQPLERGHTESRHDAKRKIGNLLEYSVRIAVSAHKQYSLLSNGAVNRGVIRP